MGEVGAVREEPFEAVGEIGKTLKGVGLHGFDGKERDEADKRAALSGRDARRRIYGGRRSRSRRHRPRGRGRRRAFGARAVVHGVGDVEEMFEELGGDVFVGLIFEGEFDGDGEHVEAEGGHPGGAVGLIEMGAAGKRCAAVEEADVVQAQEAALEDVAAFGVLAIDPPGEVDEQFLEDALEEEAVARPTLALPTVAALNSSCAARSGRPARRPRRGRAG